MDSVRVTKWPASVNNLVPKSLDLNIYPNPNNGVFSVAVPDIATTVSVYDITGKMLFTKGAEGATNIHVDLAEKVAPGLYIVHLSNQWGTTVGKVFIR